MNSFNHYAYGAVCQWLFEAVAGFRPNPENPGFKHIIFEPTIIAALSPVDAHHDAHVGRIAAAWSVDGDRVRYAVSVPQGSTGTLVLASNYTDASVDGQSLPAARGKARVPLAPGDHMVVFRISGR
jgi:alpha-L-rhamnosidase